MCDIRRTWWTRTVTRPASRSGRRSRPPSSSSAVPSTDVSGERSSWLTLALNLRSRAMRVCTASAMSLKEEAMGSRSGSPARSIRVLSSPPAIRRAPAPSLRTGRRIRPDGRRADDRAEQRGEEAQAHERPPAPGEGPVEIAQGEHLDVHPRVDRDGDGEVRVAGDAEALARPGRHRSGQQVRGERVRRDGDGRGVPGRVEPDHRLGRADGRDLVECLARRRARGEVGAHGPRVEGRAGQGRVLPLVQQVPAGEGVGRDRDRSGHQEGERGERQCDARAQAQSHRGGPVVVVRIRQAFMR